MASIFIGHFVTTSPVLLTPEFAIPVGRVVVVEVVAVAHSPTEACDGNATLGALALDTVGISTVNGVTTKFFKGTVDTYGAFPVEVDMTPSDTPALVTASVSYQ